MKFLYHFHKITSILCLAGFLLLCVTGFVILGRFDFQRQTYPWKNHERKNLTQAELWDKLPDAVKHVSKKYPNAKVEGIRGFFTESVFRVYVRENKNEDGKRNLFRVFYDPQTGNIYERDAVQYISTEFTEVLRKMQKLHINLDLGDVGRNILYVSVVLALFSIVSGYLLHLRMKIGYPSIKEVSARTAWSERHVFFSLFAAPWAFFLFLSAMIMLASSDETRDFRREGIKEAKEYFATFEKEKAISLAEATALVRTKFSDRDVIEAGISSKDKLFYYQLANKSDNVKLYRSVDMLYVSSGGAHFYKAELPWWGKVREFALNVHLHNHYTLPLRIGWAILIIGSVAMAVSGFVLWLTRFFPASKVTRRTMLYTSHKYGIAAFVLTTFGLLLPFYESIGETLGAFAFAILILLTLENLLRKTF